MGLLSFLGIGNSASNPALGKLNFNLNLATPTTGVSVGTVVNTDATKGTAQVAVAVKTQDASGSAVDVGVNTQVNASPSGVSGKVDVGVKVLNDLIKVVDVTNNTLFNLGKESGVVQNTTDVATQSGDTTTHTHVDAALAATPNGALGKADVAVKVLDGLATAVNLINSSQLEAGKEGAAGKTDLGLLVQHGIKSTAVLVDSFFNTDCQSFTGKSDVNVATQGSQALTGVKLADLLQVGQAAIEFAGDHAVSVQAKAADAAAQSLFHSASDLHAALPLNHDVIA